MSTPCTRRLDRADFSDAVRLGAEAFGGTPSPAAPGPWPPEGQTAWGTYLDDRLVARLTSRHDHSWFGGVRVPTLGIASVTVEAEHRGKGLLQPLFEAAFDETLSPVSTLYPTAPGIYRRFGYEIIGALRTLEIPTARLSGVRAGTDVTTRRATETDLPAVRDCYTRWASVQNGPLTRTGPLFDSRGIASPDVVTTVAVTAGGEVAGFLRWHRGSGYGVSATLRVEDLVADTPSAASALWQMLCSFSSVAGQVRVVTSGEDVSNLVLPVAITHEVTSNPYMLRILDVVKAFALRKPSPAITADLTFAVRGDLLGRIDGCYRIWVADGTITAMRETATDASDDPSMRTWTPAGLALAWAGAQSSANLRRAGLLVGPVRDDTTWDGLLGGRNLHIRDYF